MGKGRGKVILLGEHAVVYGRPALAVGIERGAWAEARPAIADVCTMHVKGWGIDVREDGDQMLARSLGAVARAMRAEGKLDTAKHVVAETDLPPAGGLGCSAALGVAVARALDPEAPPSKIQARVMEWERVFHGNPSGIDGAVATTGGCILFRKGKPVEPIRSRTPLHLAIGHSGIASSTKSMVESVAKQMQRNPAAVEKAWDGVEALVQNASAALVSGDLEGLGNLLDMNQLILSGLMLSTPEIEQMCQLARTEGAFGAKLTGAGGGGCVVSLVRDAEAAERVIAAWSKGGYAAFYARLAEPSAPESARPEASP
jgi:mevalonate kinase